MEFGGFTDQQLKELALKMGFDGPLEKFNEFLAASPGKAAMLSRLTKEVEMAPSQYASGGMVDFKNTTNTAIKNPDQIATTATASQIKEQSNQFINQNSGNAGKAHTANTATAGNAAQAQAGQQPDTATADAATSAGGVDQALQGVEAAQGEVSDGAVADAATTDPKSLEQLQLEAAQINDPQQVQFDDQMEVGEGELVDGSSVDMSQVEALMAEFQAAQGNPSKQATVQGQLEELMKDFEGDKTPPWAAGAIRAANAQMAARGLSASSMAGAAILQATMEAAVPIAAADAQTFAAFEMQNLNNRQQVVMAAAQQRAAFLGQAFDQDFQSKVFNASRIAEIANINHNTGVQIALENSRLAQQVDLANLDARNAKILSDAAAMTSIEQQNLNNRQQAAVQNAQAFLQMDLANLSNEQQTAIFKAQSRVQALFSDQAAENAMRQFNASSENQANQFFSSLEAQVSQFNASQKNAISMFNTEQRNALGMFNSNQINQRDQFNAQNRLIIDQSNAQWRQQIATTNNAEANETNRLNAQLMTGMTTAAYNNLWQRERDVMAFAFTAAENSAQRAHEVVLQKLGGKNAKSIADQQSKDSMYKAAGSLIGSMFRL